MKHDSLRLGGTPRSGPSEDSLFAAIYARRSSPRENFSIGQQVSECWKFSDSRGWKPRYVFVDELPAKNTDRPNFQLMLEKAKKSEFGVIVFWKLDRFARSLVDTVNLQRMLKGYGVELASVTEYLDTSSPVGRFNFRNLASVAELEREMIGQRAQMGMYGLAQEHRWPNKHPPVGYYLDREGRLHVERTGARVVAYVFQQYLASKSMPHVAFLLGLSHVSPPRGGNSWTPSSVRTVLTNPLYVGEYAVAGYREHLKELRIITTEDFDMVQKTLGRYREGHEKRPQMPTERKASMLNKMAAKYEAYLSATVAPRARS